MGDQGVSDYQTVFKFLQQVFYVVTITLKNTRTMFVFAEKYFCGVSSFLLFGFTVYK